MKDKRVGFTVIEVLTAITIVAILTGMILIVVGPGISHSKTHPVCASNLKQWAAAYNIYMADHDGQPPNAGLIFLVKNGYLPKTTIPLSCPLNRSGQYWDDYGASKLVGVTSKGSKLANAVTFSNGNRIPMFDIDSDVIVRCLDHGFDGNVRGGSKYRVISMETSSGKNLGVLLNGSIVKVPPVPCWEAATFPVATLKASESKMFGHCFKNK